MRRPSVCLEPSEVSRRSFEGPKDRYLPTILFPGESGYPLLISHYPSPPPIGATPRILREYLPPRARGPCVGEPPRSCVRRLEGGRPSRVESSQRPTRR
jgi:hypothetical protein